MLLQSMCQDGLYGELKLDRYVAKVKRTNIVQFEKVFHI